MIDDSNPDYRRARMRFDPVMAHFRARAERVKEETDARSEEIAEYERAVEERRRAREEGQDRLNVELRESDAQTRTFPRPARGRHAKPEEDQFDEDDFSNNNFLR
ncbi:hypothetical protein SAMN06265360_115141 [Haloechinothrix alba]|uniref:Uncharacterized protein n=1 Tax=Haloechinothrix alba TaxID=664784 RepID=A0A238YJU2_9PSEU|nr:hypothetical protein [Haloechinothrix alba]SNR71526.1 hypothetical protein SAMN06265360_115141 [Haloechinothrix alba]